MSEVDDVAKLVAEYFAQDGAKEIVVSRTGGSLTAAGEPFYERDRLLDTLSRRLVGLCEQENPEKMLLVSVAKFVRALVLMESAEQLYFFTCNVSGKRQSGWASSDRIFFVPN